MKHVFTSLKLASSLSCPKRSPTTRRDLFGGFYFIFFCFFCLTIVKRSFPLIKDTAAVYVLNKILFYREFKSVFALDSVVWRMDFFIINISKEIKYTQNKRKLKTIKTIRYTWYNFIALTFITELLNTDKTTHFKKI